MKNLILTLLFVITNSFYTYSQSFPDFNDTIHIKNSDAFFNVFQNDSCYYTVGRDSCIYFAKFDFQGNLIDTTFCDIDVPLTFYHNYSDIRSINNKFVIFSNKPTSDNIGRGYIAVLNNNFDTVWTKTYNQSDFPLQTYNSNVFTDIQETPDGGYIIAGYNKLTPTVANKLIAYLLKIDCNGNIQWYKEFPDVYYIVNFKLTPDMGILIYAIQNNKQSIIKTTALGNTIWKKYFKKREIFGGQNDLQYAGGDDFVILRAKTYGVQSNTSNVHSGVNLVKINHLTGSFIFDTIYRPFYDFPMIGTIKMKILSNRKIVVYGSPFSKEPGILDDYCVKGAAVVYNTNGDSLTTDIFQIGVVYHRDDWLADLDITPDGGFIGCGEHTTITLGHCYSSPWIFKYTPDWATNIKDIIPLETSLNGYPNPTNNIFNIEFKESKNHSLSLIIYNINGSEIKKHIIPKGVNKYQIDLESLDSGIYLYKVMFHPLRSSDTIIHLNL